MRQPGKIALSILVRAPEARGNQEGSRRHLSAV